MLPSLRFTPFIKPGETQFLVAGDALPSADEPDEADERTPLYPTRAGSLPPPRHTRASSHQPTLTQTFSPPRDPHASIHIPPDVMPRSSTLGRLFSRQSLFLAPVAAAVPHPALGCTHEIVERLYLPTKSDSETTTVVLTTASHTCDLCRKPHYFGWVYMCQDCDYRACHNCKPSLADKAWARLDILLTDREIATINKKQTIPKQATTWGMTTTKVKRSLSYNNNNSEYVKGRMAQWRNNVNKTAGDLVEKFGFC